MKKHKNVQEILRRNGVSGYIDLNNVDILGGYHETYVMWLSGNSAKISNAGTNTPDDVELVTGDTSISVGASGETYFLLSGTSEANVNGISFKKYFDGTTYIPKISGNIVENGDDFDGGDGNYYTYLGMSKFGVAVRILNLENSGVTDISLESIEISGDNTVVTGATIQLEATGTYTNSTTTDVTDDVRFTSENEDIATVTLGGEVEGISAGTVTITATYNDPLTEETLTNTYDITVTE